MRIPLRGDHIKNLNYHLFKFVVLLNAGVTPTVEEKTTESEEEEECEEEEEEEGIAAGEFSLPEGVSETGSSRP